ncbi:MAG: DUF4870 domain-containing protein [Flavobacteriaceae bacterium]|nr:DUF4870 domain-containing protein [Flavobacteriaceae bacterium]
MIENRQLIVLMHLAQLIDLLTGVGGLIVPLVIWSVKKEEVYQLDRHGKQIINFQLSMILYSLIAIPLVFLLGFGFLILIAVGLLCLVYPIVNALRASSGQDAIYPFSIRFLK